TVGERGPGGASGQDYRLLAPNLVTDANGNRAAIAHDVLGYVAGSAAMGKRGDAEGDTLNGFEANLSEAAVEGHFSDPLGSAVDLLGSATCRYVYDVYAFQRGGVDHPTAMSAICRTTHTSDLGEGENTGVMLTISYFSGTGQAIQAKAYAGAGPL